VDPGAVGSCRISFVYIDLMKVRFPGDAEVRANMVGRRSLVRAMVLSLLALVSVPPTESHAQATFVLPPVVVTPQRTDRVGVGAHVLDDESVARLVDLGVRHVRTTLYWSEWSDPAYRQGFTRDLRRALAAGLEPLVVIHQPPFGSYAERDRVYPEFARFIAARAAEFPEVRYWQLWNEMDLGFTDVFGAGRPEVSMHQRGRHYAEMLAIAYPALKTANPSAIVVTGGIASDIDGGFLQGMYHGAARYDVLAIHSYGFPVSIPFRERGVRATAIMRANGDDRPLWNTEFGMEAAVVAPGWPATPADIDRYHLDAWRESILANDRERIYARVYGHVLRQAGDLSHDLVRTDGSPRPAYTWLRGWLRGG
jgi:hypothetical protein